MPTLELAIVAFLGLAIGSFLNVVVHRLPRKESLVSPGSRCPSCGYSLRAADNVPILSYLFLGGRCRRCRTHISIRYPVIELITGVLFVSFYFAYGWAPLLAVRLLFLSAMIALFAIDLEHHLLPDAITLPGIVVGLVASVFLPPGIVSAIIGTILGGGVLWAIGEAYYRYSGQEGMGGGDVKMLAMIGAFLGWELVIVTLVFSSIAGSVIGVLVIAIKRGGLKYALPYGTFLAIAAVFAALWGEQILAWYTGLYYQ